MQAIYARKEGILISRPKAIDLSHHLSDVAKARSVSPLKGLQRHLDKEGVVYMSVGFPNPAYFPFAQLEAEALNADNLLLPPKSTTSTTLSWLFNLLRGSDAPSQEQTTHLTIQKYPAAPGDLNLATALQYGLAKGVPQLQEFVDEVTRKIHKPAYKNYVNLIHAGNTDGWFKCVHTLCNRGDGVLVSEWTYPSAIATMVPYGIKPIPVSMDGQGMSAEGLRKVLSEWDVAGRGMSRPHVLYTVPVGQNPTGSTMGGSRKKELYDICVEFDIIIVEDDPYYFLQLGHYAGKADRQTRPQDMNVDAYIAQLVPSFLSIDYQGRVIRLESFSKIISPGCRLGWFTCNPIFAERLERHAETSTQAPCGYGQSMTTALLLQWKYNGYIRWVGALADQYRQRRDFLLDCITEEFDLKLKYETSGVWSGCQVYQAYDKGDGDNLTQEKWEVSQPVFSFVPPTSGMYIWMQLHLNNHSSPTEADDPESLEMKLWIELAEAGVVFSPGWMFSAKQGDEDPLGGGHFRISYSNVEFDDMKRAMAIFATVIRRFLRK